MKILMTGSHGFVGSNLIEALSGENEIIRWDIRSDDDLPECDVVIHLAGKAHDTKNTTEEEEYYHINTDLTKKIFDAFLRSNAKKFIFFSSIKAKDNDTPYAKSKKAAEDYIHNQLKVKSEKLKDRDTYILRPCMIHGKGVKGNLPLLFKFVRKGWPWPLAAFENKRSYASMGNVNFVVNELLKHDIESGIYNLCDDDPVSTNDLIRMMSECLGRKAKMIRVPKAVVYYVAKIGNCFHLPLNTEWLRKLTGDNVIDNSKLKRSFCIDHLPIKAIDGLKTSIEDVIMRI